MGGRLFKPVFSILMASFFGLTEAAHSQTSYLATATPEDFVREVQSQALPLEEWIERTNQSPYNFICFGEVHSDEHRQRTAGSIFSHLKIDYLFLEGTDERVQEILTQTHAATHESLEQVRLLGSPVGPLLRRTLETSPAVKIRGVEMTSDQARELNLQKADSGPTRMSRDGFIASNILQHYRQGQTSVALYGASHCAKNNVDSGWMRPFQSMLKESLPDEEKVLSVKIVLGGEPFRTPLNPENTLLLYLQNSSLHGRSFVIPNMSGISRRSFNGKASLAALFESYDALVVLWP